MGLAYFDVVDDSAQHGRYVALAATAGPWSPQLQHGGPPTALLIDVAERLVTAETGRTDLVAARLAAEFVGPVPVAEVATTASVVRNARSAALVEASLSSGGRECLHARIWFVAEQDTAQLAATGRSVELPDRRPGLGLTFPYGESIEWRMVAGSITQPGPGAVWARPQLSIVEGRHLSGLQRAALIGDSASGISSALDWDAWSFVNVDLDVHLARPVRGEWLLMDAETQLGTHGFALARSTLSDVGSVVGATAQTLVLAPRQR